MPNEQGPWSRLLAAAELAAQFLEDSYYNAVFEGWDDHEALVAYQELTEAADAVRGTKLNADALPKLLAAAKDARSLIGVQYVGPSYQVSLRLADVIVATQEAP